MTDEEARQVIFEACSASLAMLAGKLPLYTNQMHIILTSAANAVQFVEGETPGGE